MMYFVIIEDNKYQSKKVKKIILTFMMNNKLEFNIDEYNDCSSELYKRIKNKKNNTVYILDLELPSGDGIDIARYIRHECNDWDSIIIIFTAHTSLARRMYKEKLQILDFIEKCFDSEKDLFDCFSVSNKIFNGNKVYRYTYNNVDYAIPICNINYLVREDRKTKIVTTEGAYFQNISISSLKELLPSSFICSSKGIVINKENVKEIDWNSYLVTFRDGSKDYLVSKSHKKELCNGII